LTDLCSQDAASYSAIRAEPKEVKLKN